MSETERKTLQDLFIEEKEKLDAVEEKRAFLKTPANDDVPTMRPPDEIIDAHLGPELSDDAIRTKAQNKAWEKFKQQEAKEDYRKQVEERNQQRQKEMQQAFENPDAKKPSKEQDNHKSKSADQWAKDETKKREQNEQEQNRSGDAGIER